MAVQDKVWVGGRPLAASIGDRPAPLAALVRRLRDWQTLRALHALDDVQLQDIGLTREDLSAAAAEVGHGRALHHLVRCRRLRARREAGARAMHEPQEN